MKKLNAKQLKILAIITMLIDHTAVALYGIVDFITDNYSLMRAIGRIAFPIFVFMLVEGFYKTHDRIKYMRNMFIFALISEIPFNLLFRDSIFATDYQNIYFTLLIGLISIYFIDKSKNTLLTLSIAGLACLTGQILNVDYRYLGVLAIIIFYLSHNFKDNKKRFIMYSLAFAFEYKSFVHISNVLLSFFYNGERGKQNKWFFYIFYPAHLLILYFLKRYLIGL